MTTYFAFAPPPNNAFSFQPTLDNQTANAVVWWNTDGQRWFVSVSVTGQGNLFNVPAVGSPPVVQIQSLSWANGMATVETDDPHGFEEFATTNVTVSGCTPADYNGLQEAFITGPTTLTYQLRSNPGASQGLGTVSYDINLGAGYLKGSTIVYRPTTRMFEVQP